MATLFFGCYILAIGGLMLLGAHRFLMLWLYYRNRRTPGRTSVFPVGAHDAPVVTVQLPLYNERYVAERLIDAACTLEYPMDKLEIQVLDDSTDDTADIVARVVHRWRRRGVAVQHVRRDTRAGYKAGALAYGTERARGEFLAVFDADFVPPQDFLKRTLPVFADEAIGMVQARWGHLNKGYSLLTRVQALLLDGHFILEHGARSRSGRFFNFNGTAGVWRRVAIDAAGGWRADTLTEDLDLSYRAQLAGWKFAFLPDVIAPAELPVEMNAFKNQQYRWAKGSIETARRILPALLTSRLPVSVKLEAVAHLTANSAYLLVIMLTLALPGVIWSGLDAPAAAHAPWMDAVVFAFATISVAVFYLAAGYAADGKILRTCVQLPALMAVGIGLAVNNAAAVIDALAGRRSEFVRTPKYAVRDKRDSWTARVYRGRRSWMPYVELTLGAYSVVTAALAVHAGLYASLPFLLLFAVGFVSVGSASLWQGRGRRALTLPPALPESLHSR